MIFPMQFPDEIFASVLTRMCRLNGITDFCDIARLYFSDSPCVSFIDAKIDLPVFCQRTKNAYGDSVSLLENMTWLGFATRLGSFSSAEIRKISDGELRPALSRLTFADSTILRFCPTCRERDIESLGMSYWRQIHQLPVVFFCPTHTDPLILSEVKRRQLHQSFPLPGDFDAQCADSGSSAVSNNAFWQGVSTFAQRFVGEPFPYDGKTIRAVIIDSLRERTLAKTNDLLQTAELVGQLIARLETMPAKLVYLNKTLFAKRIVQSINELERAMTFGRLVMIYWLFGTWDDFVERCRWVNVFGIQSDIARPYVKLERSEKSLSEYHRERCEEFLNKNPDCSRLDLTRAEYRSFRWLLHYDSFWLNRLFPVPNRAEKQYRLFDE
jgi:hypothetical protein